MNKLFNGNEGPAGLLQRMVAIERYIKSIVPIDAATGYSLPIKT